MSYETHAPQAGFTPPAPGPIEPPKQLRTAVMLMFILLGIGVVSMLIDFMAAGVVADELAGKVTHDGKPVGRSWFNFGTMYVTLGFGVIIGGLGFLVRKGANGARITGAIFAIIFALMGLTGIGMTFLMAAAAQVSAENQGLGEIVPAWYVIGGLVIGLVQATVAIIAIVKLFNRNTAEFCKQPK
ncbi:MAG: hypothetical protein ACRD0P_04240 [Stackebrandtia sp.]